MRRDIVGGSYTVPDTIALLHLIPPEIWPEDNLKLLSFRLTKVTKPSSNTGEDEQPDSTTAHGVRV